MRKLYATFLISACALVSLPSNAQAEWKMISPIRGKY